MLYSLIGFPRVDKDGHQSPQDTLSMVIKIEVVNHKLLGNPEIWLILELLEIKG